jgi:hypothetical protein
VVHFIDGRTLFSYRPRSVALNTVPIQVLAPNPNRWGVIISDSTGGPLTISVDQAIAGLNGHIFLGQATVSQPTYFNWDNIGPVILAAWYICRTLSGTSQCGVTEILYQPPSQ